MEIAFYGAGAVAVLATAMAITRSNAIHALLYMILSLLSVALIFFVLGAPFLAALEVIVYAGAIMVLFVFVVMMLDLRKATDLRRAAWFQPRSLLGPAALALLLLVELVYVLTRMDVVVGSDTAVEVREVSLTLFGPYLIGVELASILLLAGLIGAYHLGQQYGQQRDLGSSESDRS